MEGMKGDKKINRRRTRNRTQVINFDLSELETLRKSMEPKRPSTPDLAQMSLNSFLANNYENEEETHGIKSKRHVNMVKKVSEDMNLQNMTNSQTITNTITVTNLHTMTDKMNMNKIINNTKPTNMMNTINIKKQIISTNLNQRADQSIQRMFDFNEISNFFKKLEKRELFPKSKHDYAYKKSKGGKAENVNLLEEKNLIHMRIEEEVIPCLNNNPFIRNDKLCKK